MWTPYTDLFEFIIRVDRIGGGSYILIAVQSDLLGPFTAEDAPNTTVALHFEAPCMIHDMFTTYRVTGVVLLHHFRP